jgi:ketosteroid isomerase-like protein
MDAPQTADAAPQKDDRAAIGEVIRGWAEASAAKDIDKVMSYFSEDFSSDILDNKAQMREFWGLAIEHGMTDGMKIRFDPAEIVIEADTATTGRVYHQATTGGYYQILVLLKEQDGVWRIIDSYS